MLGDRDQYAVGVDIGGSVLKCGLVSGCGEIVWHQKLPTPKGYGAVVKLLRSLIRQAIAEEKPPNGRVVGIGIGVAGLVDRQSGVVVFSTHLGWQNVPLAQDLAGDLQIPASLEMDARCSALGELHFGHGKSVKDFAFISLGTSIGCGLVLGGKVYRGGSGMSGNLTHCTVVPDGPPCTCGQRGCLETYASSWALEQRCTQYLRGQGQSSLARIAERGFQALSPIDIAEAARAGDRFASMVVAEFIHYLSVSIANLVSLLDLRLIILGGGLLGIADDLPAELETRVRERLLPPYRPSLRIRRTALGDLHGVLGAAVEAFTNEDPNHETHL